MTREELVSNLESRARAAERVHMREVHAVTISQHLFMDVLMKDPGVDVPTYISLGHHKARVLYSKDYDDETAALHFVGLVVNLDEPMMLDPVPREGPVYHFDSEVGF